MALRSMSPGVRVGLAVFPAVTLWLGAAYALQPSSRMTSGVFATASDTLPMRGWGVVFLTVGAVAAVALAANKYEGYVVAMVAGSALYGWWAAVYVGASLTDPAVSLGAGAWPAGMLLFHLSALLVLAKGG